MFAKQRARLALAIIIVIVSVVLSFSFTQHTISRSEDAMRSDALLRHFAESQRPLSQQIVDEISADVLNGVEAQVPLDTLANKLQETHKLLLGNTKAGIVPLDGQLLPQYRAANTSFNAFFDWLDVATAGNATTGDIQQLVKKHEAYLADMDKFIENIVANTQAKMAASHRVEVISIICSLLIIFIEVIVLLLPAVKNLYRLNNMRTMRAAPSPTITPDHLRVIRD